MSQTRMSLARRSVERGGRRCAAALRATLLAGTGALALGAFGLAGCAAEYYPVSTSPVYLGPDERVIVRGASTRRAELNRYFCAGDMVLVCDIRGAVAECACGGTSPIGFY